MAPTFKGSDSALWPDLPRGPLSSYRARASFSAAALQLFLEGEDVVRFKVRLGARWCVLGMAACTGRNGSAALSSNVLGVLLCEMLILGHCELLSSSYPWAGLRELTRKIGTNP